MRNTPRCASLGSTSTLLGAAALLASCSPLQAPSSSAIQAAAVRVPAPLERVSLSDSEGELFSCTTTRPPCKNASHPTISFDARRVAFDCDANGVVPGFGNDSHVGQTYVRDLASGSTILVSAARDKNNAIVPPNGPSTFAEISGDGEYVAFSSVASNLVEGDDEKLSDVFLARIAPFELVSVVPMLDGESESPSISFDARFVAFASSARNFVGLRAAGGAPSATAPTKDRNVFVIDRSSGSIEWLSRKQDGAEPNGPSSAPAIDDAGLRVAFTSEATDLFSSDANGSAADVFVADRETGQLQCVSLRYDGLSTANAVSRKPTMSGNGRFVAFESNASDLLRPGEDTNGQSDVFVRDLQPGRIARMSLTASGGEARGPSGYAAISSDGRFVAFTSLARNLTPGDETSNYFQFFVRDRDVSGDGAFDEPGDVRTLRLSTAPDGSPANARSGGNADLAADGRTAVFMSESNLLVGGDTNGVGVGMGCSPTCVFGRDVFLVHFD
jgi:Tol biopolymer transport system component